MIFIIIKKKLISKRVKISDKGNKIDNSRGRRLSVGGNDGGVLGKRKKKGYESTRRESNDDKYN